MLQMIPVGWMMMAWGISLAKMTPSTAIITPCARIFCFSFIDSLTRERERFFFFFFFVFFIYFFNCAVFLPTQPPPPPPSQKKVTQVCRMYITSDQYSQTHKLQRSIKLQTEHIK